MGRINFVGVSEKIVLLNVLIVLNTLDELYCRFSFLDVQDSSIIDIVGLSVGAN